MQVEQTYALLKAQHEKLAEHPAQSDGDGKAQQEPSAGALADAVRGDRKYTPSLAGCACCGLQDLEPLCSFMHGWPVSSTLPLQGQQCIAALQDLIACKPASQVCAGD